MPLGRTCRGFLRRELFIECFNVSFLFKAAHNRKPTGKEKGGSNPQNVIRNTFKRDGYSTLHLIVEVNRRCSKKKLQR